MAESSGQGGDPYGPTLRDYITTKTKKKKKKKGKQGKHSKGEKERVNKDDALGNDEECMDWSESGSHQSSREAQQGRGFPKTKESQSSDDGKDKLDDPKRETESCPVGEEGKIENEEAMDCECTGSHKLDGAAEGNKSQSESKDVQAQNDGKHSENADKEHMGDGTPGEQKDQHPMDCTDSTTNADINKEQNTPAHAGSGVSGKSAMQPQSRWDQRPPDSETASVLEEQHNQRLKPTNTTDSIPDSSTNKGQNIMAPAADSAACGQPSSQVRQSRWDQPPSKNEKTPSSVEDNKHTAKDRHMRGEHGGDQGRGQHHKQRHQQHEHTERRAEEKKRRDTRDSRGRYPHDPRSAGHDGEHPENRRDSRTNQRSGKKDRRHEQNWRKDGREDYQTGGSMGQWRESGGDRPDRNPSENRSNSRTQSWERPKYTVGTAPDGKEQFAFFFRGDSPFSQWHFCNFTVDEKEFMCAEQFMMYKKAILFGDEEVAQWILDTDDPREQKQLGREVRDFDEETWSKNCMAIVTEGNLAKFRQNPGLRKVLLETAGMTLVEASPFDRIWGIGLEADDPQAVNRRRWRGSNLLGRILTNVREQIIREGSGGGARNGRSASDKGGSIAKDSRSARDGAEVHTTEGARRGPVRKLDRNFGRGREHAREGATDDAARRDSKGAVGGDDEEQFEFFSGEEHPFHLQYPCTFTVDGQKFNCAEQHLLYHRTMFAGYTDVANNILSEKDVSNQKRLSKKAKNFDKKKWNSEVQSVMFSGNLAKFEQNPEICMQLLRTTGRTLALTDQSGDNYWGIGLSADSPQARKRKEWKGKNVLGDVLTSVRDKILQERKEKESEQMDTSVATTAAAQHSRPPD